MTIPNPFQWLKLKLKEARAESDRRVNIDMSLMRWEIEMKIEDRNRQIALMEAQIEFFKSQSQK